MSEKKKSKESSAKTATGQTGKTKDSPDMKSEEDGVVETQMHPVVGIGASAGGLDALEKFLDHTPPDTGAAFVLITHLPPGHKSLMPELLKKYSKMRIMTVTDGMAIEQNTVYMIPPDKNISVSDGVLKLTDMTAKPGNKAPIDFFLTSLARERGSSAAGIVLSGTGTDGTVGLRAIRGEGGLVIVQEPESARYDGMPRSAITSGVADYVLTPEEMPQQLLSFWKRIIPVEQRPTEHIALEKPKAIQRILQMLRGRSGHDFSAYKINTIHRRLARRLAVHQISDIDEYIELLLKQPEELDQLFKELLIGVTSFFRDPEGFELLKTKVFPALLDEMPADHIVRVWVPGCSTGEEAYSVAIALHEYMDDSGHNFRSQIFGTDIDPQAVATARAGIYPDGVSVDVSPERLKKYFSRDDSYYRIRKDIREMLLFAVQNVIYDPPFTKLDLISCRNLLIYLNADSQKHILPIFHYSLLPNGILFLGSSETVGTYSDLFSVIDSKWKLFRRKETVGRRRIPLQFPYRSIAADMEVDNPDARPKTPTGIRLSDSVERLLLDDYAPPCAITDPDGNILYIHGHTGRYLEPAAGEASLNIVEMAREGLRIELSAGLRQAGLEKSVVEYPNIRVRIDNEIRVVDLMVRRLAAPPELSGSMLVTFHEVAAHKEDEDVEAGNNIGEQRIIELERELKHVRQNLSTTIEELQTSNEELKSTNEELQSANEELQSANEESETAQEELQSLNEELETVNAELNARVDELSETNDDMRNLLDSTGVATIFLTEDFKVKRFTPGVTSIFKLISSDIGRPLDHIADRLEYENLIEDAEKVLRTLAAHETEVRTTEEDWFLMRILPYRTFNNVIEGVVITFSNITQQKLDQEKMEELNRKLEERSLYSANIIDTLREPFIVLDHELKVVSASPAFYRNFGVSQKETVSSFIYDLGNGQWDIPRLRGLLEQINSSNARINDFVVEHDFPNIGQKTMSINARRIDAQGPARGMILMAIEDISRDPSSNSSDGGD